MKTSLKSTLKALVCAASFATLASAANAENVIAIIDVQQVLSESVAAKGIADQLNQQRQKYQDEIGKKEEQLAKEEQELIKQRSVLPEDAFNKKRDEFEKKVQDFQTLAQSRKETLDNAFNDSMSQVQKAMLDIIDTLSKDKGANIVLSKQQVVIKSDDKMEITQDVISQLNQKLPKVAVNLKSN